MLVLKLQNFESSYTSLIIYVVSNDVLYNCGIYFIRFDSRENEIHSYLIFVSLWVLLIYSPVAHWVWGGGWISKIGAIDYAGGTVVHITSGVSGLVLGIMIGIGKRKKTYSHNLLITLIGGILVWLDGMDLCGQCIYIRSHSHDIVCKYSYWCKCRCFRLVNL